MPANLPPRYKDAELRLRRAVMREEKEDALREMIALLPKHKGTEKLLGDLRKRLSKLKEEAQHARRPGTDGLLNADPQVPQPHREPHHVPALARLQGDVFTMPWPLPFTSQRVGRQNAVRAEIVDGSGRSRQPRSPMVRLAAVVIQSLVSLVRSRRELLLENLALRQQLATMVQRLAPASGSPIVSSG